MTPVSPWPGPVPYNEMQRRLFFGRRKEVDDIVDRRLSASPIVIFTGDSGAGKTSVLTAGVFPRLWLTRALDLAELGRTSQGPTLLLRAWSRYDPDDNEQAPAAMTLAARVAGAFEEAISRAVTYLRHEADDLEADEDDPAPGAAAVMREEAGRLENWQVPRGGSPLRPFLEFARQDGAVFILDQYEELLRALGDGGSREANRLVAAIQREAVDARIVVSLRQEYVAKLSTLDREIPDLKHATVYLQPMERQALLESTLQAASIQRVPVDSDVVERVLARQEREDGAVDAMSLQAALTQMFHGAVTYRRGEPPRVTSEDCDRFLKGFPEPGRLSESALQWWIERKVDAAFPADAPGTRLLADRPWPADLLLGFQRSLVVRVAPYLSAGGFKVLQRQADLEDHIQRDLMEAPPSGVARDWLPGVVERQIYAALGAALRALADHGLLKEVDVQRAFSETTSTGATRSSLGWELSHDRLGPPLLRWAAEQRRTTWEQAVCSATGVLGDAVKVGSGRNRPKGIVERVQWIGAWVGADEGAAVFEDIVFRDCVFRGTLFFGCTFRRVRMERCILDAALFKHCVFEGTEGDPGLLIDGEGSTIRGLSLTDCIVEEMELCDVSLLQPWVAGVEVKGAIRLTGRAPPIVSAGFFQEIPPVRGGPALHYPDGTRFRYCSWDDASEIALGWAATDAGRADSTSGRTPLPFKR